MNSRDADPAVLIGQVSLSTAPLPGTSEPHASSTADGPDAEELLDYVPVPLRKSKTVLVRVRAGDRLKPLPYSLDEEDS